MHSLVRLYIKTAIFYLATGLAIGGWLVVRRELYSKFPSPYETSAHTHALLVGFVMMMILGVALWLFPRPDKSDGRYSPGVARVAYWLLAIGTGARVIGELARATVVDQWLRWVVVIASMAQILGILLFFHTMWGRIRPLGSQIREARGERF